YACDSLCCGLVKCVVFEEHGSCLAQEQVFVSVIRMWLLLPRGRKMDWDEGIERKPKFLVLFLQNEEGMNIVAYYGSNGLQEFPLLEKKLTNTATFAQRGWWPCQSMLLYQELYRSTMNPIYHIRLLLITHIPGFPTISFRK